MIRQLHLSMLAGPVVPVPVPHAVMDAFQSATITNATGERSGFQIAFSLSTRSPLHTIFVLSGGGAPPLLRVILMAVVNGLPQVLMDGVVTRTEVTAGTTPGQNTLTVSGTDLSTVMDLIELTGMPYPGMPEEARIGVMLAKYAFMGIVPLVIPRLFPDVPVPTHGSPSSKGLTTFISTGWPGKRATFSMSILGLHRGSASLTGGRKSKWASRNRR